MTNLRSLRRQEPPQVQTQPRVTREEARKRYRYAFLRLNPGPALEALREAESALALWSRLRKSSLRAPQLAMVDRALEKVRETLAMYREAGV